LFCIVRFGLLPMNGPVAVFFETCAAAGAAVVLGLMTFGFFGRIASFIIGGIAGALCLYYFVGTLRDYQVLLASLTAYGVSAIVCTGITLLNKERFDFDLLAKRITSFNEPITPNKGVT